MKLVNEKKIAQTLFFTILKSDTILCWHTFLLRKK